MMSVLAQTPGDIESQPVYVFHVSRANRDEIVYGRILEEGVRHYKILLDYPWQEGNRTRTILKSDLSGTPVIELRADRDARIKKGWEDYFDSRGEVNVGTIENPKPVPKQAFDLAKRAREMAADADKKWAANFPRVAVNLNVKNNVAAHPNKQTGLQNRRKHFVAAGVVLLVAAAGVIVLLRPVFVGGR